MISKPLRFLFYFCTLQASLIIQKNTEEHERKKHFFVHSDGPFKDDETQMMETQKNTNEKSISLSTVMGNLKMPRPRR